MTDTATIVDEFERQEAYSGGYKNADYVTIRNEVAEFFGVTPEHVRRVMLDHWAKRGGG